MKFSLQTTFIMLSLITVASYGSLQATEVSGEDTKAYEIMKKASDLVDYKSISMKISLKTYNPSGGIRVREIESSSLSVPGVSKMIIRISAPPDQKGITMLIHDYPDKSDDMWIYLPSLRKSRRIVSSEKSSQFMGSEFLNSDMSRPRLEDYSHTLKDKTGAGEGEFWIIESVAVNESVVKESDFYKKISYISKDENLCRKTEFYDKNGTLLRNQLITKFIRNGPDKYIAAMMEVTNHKSGRRSTIEITVVKEKEALRENSFDPAMLR
ncbi:MAG: outer membrane lipoprotein-sorting protein [Bacteroidales bacterium]|nr:outer membrane lipoprotein-sorting protein [Bacteroidales bacterium]MDD2424645.1 outer membrane lipoprotein-sorting protein [Bacteroidales bacterium]MDD3989135.1 outer membrane lipoprotein-sorting protein [Bacteroidales bacterium]MDD4638851.1 outer membrane lipoprotein-sorting protein [Bacteroidales bacterium]